MKQILLAAAALAVVMGVAGSGQAADKKVFALVPKAMNNPFFDLARDGCMKAAEESGGKFECLYIGPGEHTEAEQVEIVQDLITKKVDGIAVSPSNAAAMAVALKAAQDAKIPTLTWDADVLPQDKGVRAAFIGTKNYDIGVNLAKLAQEMKPKGGLICLQTGGAAADNHNQRLQGIRDTLAGRTGTSAPGDKLKGENGWTECDVSPLITNDDGAVAVQQLQDTLAKYPKMDVFITTGAFTQWGDNAYRQAVKPVEAKVKDGSLLILSADTLAMQMQQLKDGLSNGQVGQRPFQMGYLAMQRLEEITEGKTLTDPEYTGLDVCTQKNVDKCLGQ